MRTIRRRSWVILLACAAIIKIFSLFPAAVERYYSHGIYPVISAFQRLLLGWIPFSIGDIGYTVAGIYLLYSLVTLIRKLFRREHVRQALKTAGTRFLFSAISVYVVFNLFWGLNYNRLPMMQQMGMEVEEYSTDNLRSMVELLITKVNGLQATASKNRDALKRKRYLFNEVGAAYATVKQEHPELAHRLSSVKPSLFSYAGNYLGFTGYYNPFTGEAQTNTTVPVFLQPFTTCHELGHQLGYAKENEANFAGFLSARASTNPSFQYSVYFDMYTYAMRELFVRDSTEAKKFRLKVSSGVRQDIQTLRAFYLSYESPVEPFIRDLYANYLRANQQPSGLHSYNEVIAMLLGYYRKYGHI